MIRFLNLFATALTIAFFIIVGITGIAMFFHLGGALFKHVHEWLGLLFVAVVLLHLARHWRVFLVYFKRGSTYASFALALVVSVIFAWPVLTGSVVQGGGQGPGGGRGQGGRVDPASFAIIDSVSRAPLSVVAELLGTDSAALSQRLADLGVMVSGPDQSLADAAAASRKNVSQVLGEILR